ncbi:MAG: CotH kinase family protein [Bacteroidaceae bacterium]|nr:CotH kinase family protein [Bacteroidaceae bacterium]
MKRIFTTLLFAIITIIATSLCAQQQISLPYIAKEGMPGKIENSVTRQYVWESPQYLLDTTVRGIRLTFLESDYLQLHNGYCMVALSELHFFDANGIEIIYGIGNIECNSIESTEGYLEALYDNDYTTYYHSVWKDALVDNDSEVYVDVDFQRGVSAFSFSYRTRNHNIYPTAIAITATGTAYDADTATGDNSGNSGNSGDNSQDFDEEFDGDIDYTPVDVYNTECLFVTLADGGIDAYPLESMSGDYTTSGGTLSIPLKSGGTIEYKQGTYSQYGTDVPQLPYMTSYKFNNKYNANLNVDIEAENVTENMSFDVNAIGKSLTASFQLSDNRAVAYVGKKQQVSKETRNRFDAPVKYAVTYPGYNVMKNVKVQDEKWEYGEDAVTEISLTEDMLYTNKPSETGDYLKNMLDGNPSTIFHTVYGSSYDASVMPYITITLDSPVEIVKFYYMSRTMGDYNPKQLNLYACNDNSSWKLVRSFSSTDGELPLETGAEYTSPAIELGGSYRYLKLEQTASEHRNNHMVFAEFRLYNVVPGNGEAVKVQDAVYRNVRIPFGRIYTINTNWHSDNGSVPRIDIDIENGLSVTSKEYYLSANFRITGYGMYDDFVDSVQIKGRGNSTWSYSKKPYRLKFDKKVKPFGLTKGKSWVLLANAQTGAMMANAVAMKIGQLADVPYANHIIPVELYINGEYKGNYMFTEHVGFSNNSVDVDDDLGLGYMLELDSYYDEDYRFRSTYYNLPVNVKEPDLSDYDTQTANEKFGIIKDDFNELDALLYTGGDISSKIDLDAAARFMLVNELVMNQELGHPKSTYLWREDVTSDESKIILGPLWDFDWAFGYEGSGQYFYKDYKSDYFSNGMPSGSGKSFFRQLMLDKEFQRHYYKVWKEFNDNGRIKEVVEYINDYYQFAKSSLEHNATVWSDGKTYGQKIEQMQTWMQSRFEHIFANLTEYDITDLVYTLLGDIDCNNILTVHDVAILADYILGKSDPAFNSIKADTDNNGSIDGDDLINTASAVLSTEEIDPSYVYNRPAAKASIYASSFKMEVGNNVMLPIMYTATEGSSYKAMQMDVKVPLGMLLTDAAPGGAVEGKEFYYLQTGEDTYRILVYSTDGSNFVSGEVAANLSLYTEEAIPDEECRIELINILAVNSANIEQRINETAVEFGFGEAPASCYNLVYIVDGDVYKSFSVAYGATIEPIEEPVKEGHTFSGWSEIPATMPAHDVTVTGSFSVNSYKVTFVIDGDVFDTKTVEYGAKITAPNPPVKEGHTFSGWSEIPATMPAHDVTVTGSFSVNSYTITYIVDGEVYETQSFVYGAAVEPLDEPVKEGHTFSGWSEIPATMPAHDVTVTGLFSVNSYKVTFVIDGEVFDTKTVKYGAEITLPNPPEKSGYIFSGWSGVPDTMPAEDIVITGRYIVDTTGIDSVDIDLENDEVYNLKGQRITDSRNLTRGIYIVNGKKVLIK